MINFIASCLVAAILVVLPSASPAAEKDKIRVAGSGGMIPLVTALAKHFMAERPDVLVEVSQKSIQSSGGITGTAEGRIDIGMSNRALKDEELGLGLQVTEISRVGVVFGVNKNIPAKEISSDNLCRIYEGKVANWHELGGGNQPIIALTKPEKDSQKETIRKSIPCFKTLKEAAAIRVIPTSPEMATVLTHSRSIGLTDTVDVDASRGVIVALALDGVEPSPENIRSGKYKMTQTFRLLTKGQPTGKIKDFIDYIRGPKGKKVMEENKAISIR